MMSHPRLCASRVAAMLSLAVIGLAGCTSPLVGMWSIDPVPEGQTFYVKQVEFKKDGTYTAIAKRGNENERLHGKYQYNGFNLVLTAPKRPDRRYPATIWWGKSLSLTVDGTKYNMKKE